MAQQIPLSDDARASEIEDGLIHEIAPDLAYIRAMIANVIFIGTPRAKDWTLVDAGVMGTKRLIKAEADRRFGTGVRPSRILLTHGHFDHVGVLEDLVEEWDVPVYAHSSSIRISMAKRHIRPAIPVSAAD